jgi:hypothetical protein
LRTKKAVAPAQYTTEYFFSGLFHFLVNGSFPSLKMMIVQGKLLGKVRPMRPMLMIF